MENKYFGAKLNFLAQNGEGCTPTCVATDDPNYVTPPTYLPGGESYRNSGINGLYALHCSAAFTDITDMTDWEALHAAGLLFGRVGCLIGGEKPAGTPVRKSVGACGKEIVTTITDIFTITDEAEDDDLSITELYCFLQQNQDQYLFGLTTCDGRIYAPFRASFASFLPVDTATNEDLYTHQIILEYKRSAKICLQQYVLPFDLGSLELRYGAKSLRNPTKKDKKAA